MDNKATKTNKITKMTYELESSYDLETDTGHIIISLTKIGDMFDGIPKKGETSDVKLQGSREVLIKNLSRDMLKEWLHADICFC